MKHLALVALCLLAGATLAACGQTYNDLVYPGWGSQPENQ